MDIPARARLVALLAGFVLIALTAPAWADPLILTGQTKLSASDGTYLDLFGLSVAVSGDTAVVGAPGQDTPIDNAGAAYVFVRSGSSWSEQARLIASAGAALNFFGNSVAISGDTVVAGTFSSAYVFTRSGSSWSEQTRFLAPQGDQSAYFGTAVAISGDTVVVGALGTDYFRGAVYVFRHVGSSWSEEATLLAADAGPYDSFGDSLAIPGNTLVVGASGAGAAYVFERSGSTWSQQAKLLPAGSEPDSRFGQSVAMSGETIVVGASRLDGLAYVFERSGSTWSQQAKLAASWGESRDLVGSSVAISGDMLVAGAPTLGPSGSAHVFMRRGSAWFERMVLLPSEEESWQYFGRSVGLSGTIAVTGLMTGSYVEIPGAAYVFPLDGLTVTPTAGLLTTEDGGTATFTVELNTPPAGDVVVDLASTDPAEGTVSPDRLTFTPDDWWTAQTVTLTGVDDLLEDEGRPYTATLTMNTALTEDAVYDGIDPPDVSAVNLPFEGDFYTVAPCRVLDTRLPDQEPALASGVVRTVAVHEVCGVPATARAVAINVTVIDPTAAGELTLYPGDLPAPGLGTFPFAMWRNRANNAIVLLDTGGAGTLTVSPFLAGGGTAHLILDVSGYFE